MTWLKITGESGTGKTTIARNLCFELNKIEHVKTENDVKILKKYQDNFDCLRNSFNCNNVIYVHSNFDPNSFFYAADNMDATTSSLLGVVKYSPNLSQGEVQRFILMEALNLKPNLIILDEALTGLPEAHELKILKKLKILFPDLHLLYISHRNSKSIETLFERKMEL